MSWIFHDSYATRPTAKRYAQKMVLTGLAKGVKIEKKGKKSRPYLLYILPFPKQLKGKGE